MRHEKFIRREKTRRMRERHSRWMREWRDARRRAGHPVPPALLKGQKGVRVSAGLGSLGRALLRAAREERRRRERTSRCWRRRKR